MDMRMRMSASVIMAIISVNVDNTIEMITVCGRSYLNIQPDSGVVVVWYSG